MEDDTYELFNNGIAVELLVPPRSCDCTDVGIRLRPYSKTLPKNRMVLGAGPTFAEALQDAIGKARAGRWEPLDWAARPWESAPSRAANTYGL